jgi:hypothetical protein
MKSFKALLKEKEFDETHAGAQMQRRYWEKQIQNRLFKTKTRENAKKG